MIRRPPRSTLSSSSAASDVYKRQAGTSPAPGGGSARCWPAAGRPSVTVGDGDGGSATFGRAFRLPVAGQRPFDRAGVHVHPCLLYTSPSPRGGLLSRMPT